MHWIVVIVIGAIVGFIAKLIVPGPNDPQGLILTTILGIIGSVVATWLGRIIGLYGPDQSAGFIASIVGAVIVLAVWHGATRSRVQGPRY
jgi:uncharacterized membrane protein YeaQ/YmgE (transglycosylase-associated protein family)